MKKRFTEDQIISPVVSECRYSGCTELRPPHLGGRQLPLAEQAWGDQCLDAKRLTDLEAENN